MDIIPRVILMAWENADRGIHSEATENAQKRFIEAELRRMNSLTFSSLEHIRYLNKSRATYQSVREDMRLYRRAIMAYFGGVA
jgi:hypothetical protein